MTRPDAHAEAARRSIAATLGVTVETWDTAGREGAHDLRYVVDRKAIAVEVKRLVKPQLQAALAEAAKAGYTADDRLKSSWTLELEHGARWRRVRQAATRLMLRLEAVGWPGGGDFWVLRHHDAALMDELEKLKVTGAWPSPPTDKHPPGYYVMPDGWGGGVPGMDGLPDFLSTVLAADDMAKLRRQLAEADAEERQAFLFIGNDYMAAIPLSEAGVELPNSAPVLPAEVDGVWLTTLNSGERLIAWLPCRGWINGTRWDQSSADSP